MSLAKSDGAILSSALLLPTVQLPSSVSIWPNWKYESLIPLWNRSFHSHTLLGTRECWTDAFLEESNLFPESKPFAITYHYWFDS